MFDFFIKSKAKKSKVVNVHAKRGLYLFFSWQ